MVQVHVNHTPPLVELHKHKQHQGPSHPLWDCLPTQPKVWHASLLHPDLLIHKYPCCKSDSPHYVRVWLFLHTAVCLCLAFVFV